MLASGILQPVLASSLFNPTSNEDSADYRTRQRIGSGCKELDDALKGGLNTGLGGITCVTGEKGVGKTALAFAFLATCVLASKSHQCVLIDTTGTFDVIRLYSAILARLRNNRSQNAQPHASADDETAAAELLDRVKIMRVFDFVGMVEAVGEVREELETHQREKQRETEQLHPPPVTTVAPPVELEDPKPIFRSTIPDSDDEDDVMLYDEVEEQSPQKTQQGRSTVHLQDQTEQHQGSQAENIGGVVGMIVIDNITHVVGPMMKTNYVQASALLTAFLRSLSELTRSHNLSTILINAATTALQPYSSGQPTGPTGRQNPHRQQLHPRHAASSIFASSGNITPALSPLLPSHADMHLLMSTQPLTRQDSLALQFASDQNPAHGRQIRNSERVSVIEVLGDRFADRVGRWAAVKVDELGSMVGADVESKARAE